MVDHAPVPVSRGTRVPLVLVVDDVDDIRLMYRALLEAHGFRVRTASNAETAKAYLEHWGVDIVVTDLFMPGRNDGVDLIQWIRQQIAPRPNIVAVSGAPHMTFRSSLQAARYVGADAIMVKPIEGDELVRTIQSLLKQRDSR